MSTVNGLPVNAGPINGAPAQIGNAVVISPSLDRSLLEFPLTHARIGYVNYTPDGTVTASSEQAGFEADSVQNTMTYERWAPVSLPADIVIDMGVTRSINYIGLASHSMGTQGVTIVASYSEDGVTYTSLDVNASPQSDMSMMLLFTETAARYVKLAFTGDVFSLGVIYVGKTLDMYRALYSSHTPDSMGRTTTLKPNTSVGGAFLGRSKLRQGYSNKYEWDKTPVDWYKDNVEPFSVAALDDPFFIAWNADEHPEDCLYCWCNDDISPELSGVLNFVSFSFSVEGIGHD